MKINNTKFWLVNPYGPIPSEAWREYAYVLIGKWNSEVGISTIWWTSNFSHHFKRKRLNKIESVNPFFEIHLLNTPHYKNNISLKRFIRDYIFFAKFIFSGMISIVLDGKPKCLIYTSTPFSIFVSPVLLCKLFSVPVIFYEMDDWISLLKNKLSSYPLFLRYILEPILKVFILHKKCELRAVDGAFALSSNYLNGLLKLEPTLQNKPNTIVYNSPKPQIQNSSIYDIPKSISILQKEKESNDYIYCVYAGSMNPTYDLKTVIDAAKALIENNSRYKFIFAGVGTDESLLYPYKDNVTWRITNICYLGQVDSTYLNLLYKICDIGLSCYGIESNVDMPDKAYDYLSYGLPIANSLTGELFNLIQVFNAGVNYEASNRQSIVDALLDMGSQKSHLFDLKENAIKLYNHLSHEIQRDKYLKLINQVINK